TPHGVERRAVERRRLREVDREAALADEQLRGGYVDRAGALERTDSVDAPGREMAERTRERAHDPQAVSDTDHLRRPLGTRGGESTHARRNRARRALPRSA